MNKLFISTETDFEEYAWDTFILTPMDAGCLAFIIQSSDLKFVVQTFARLAHSPRSTHRANRMYLFLPSIDFPENIFEARIQELYQMRQMDFMPDLVIAKLIIEQNSTYDDVSPGESETEISCTTYTNTLIPRFTNILLTEVCHEN
jgi:hypothetical protein